MLITDRLATKGVVSRRVFCYVYRGSFVPRIKVEGYDSHKISDFDVL